MIATAETEPKSTTWNPIADTVTTLPRSLTQGKSVTTAYYVAVRTAATTAAPPSAYRVITVAAATPVPGKITIDYEAEIIQYTDIPVGATLEYAKWNTDGTYPANTKWTALTVKKGGAEGTADVTDIAALIPAATGAALKIDVRYKAITSPAASAAPASAAVTVTIPARPATPTATDVKFTFASETFTKGDGTKVAATLKWLVGNVTAEPDNNWADMTTFKVHDTKAQSVKIRVAPLAAKNFASLPLTVSVPARAAKPNLKWDANAEKIHGNLERRDVSILCSRHH